jgi:hypothetical protein
MPPNREGQKEKKEKLVLKHPKNYFYVVLLLL